MLQEPVSPVTVRSALPSDAEQICFIYNKYIADSHITFEEEPVQADATAERIETVLHTLPWIVSKERDHAIGYAYSSRSRTRTAYRYSAESTIYLDSSSVGRGLGTQLYGALIEALRHRRLHTVISGIALPNEPSIRLHEKLGFVKTAQFREVGNKFGRWIDVGYWADGAMSNPTSLRRGYVLRQGSRFLGDAR
jgi:L-amino acid N-acyltransferase YncA